VFFCLVSLRLASCAQCCLYLYEADMIYGFLNKNEKNLDRSFNFTFRYIDDVLCSLNSSKFGDFVDRIYPIEPEIKDTTDTTRSASYLWPTCQNWQWGSVKNETLRQKRWFQFSHWTFHLYLATFQQHRHMEYISVSWSDIPELVVHIRISLINGCC